MIIFTPHIKDDALRVLWEANPDIVFAFAPSETCRRAGSYDRRNQAAPPEGTYYLTVERNYLNYDSFDGLIVRLHNHRSSFEYDVREHAVSKPHGDFPLVPEYLRELKAFLLSL